jgi:hypothetical protein
MPLSVSTLSSNIFKSCSKKFEIIFRSQRSAQKMKLEAKYCIQAAELERINVQKGRTACF